ncbi:MAG: tetratricopeptide repeat protein [Methylococcaceae bacterium]|nr:tetratricopeptide repeat protein [Methylococcaceae bacterium]
MSVIKTLHQLVDQQQFTSLKLAVNSYLTESYDIQVLPLKALAHAQLAEHAEAKQVLADAEIYQSQLSLNALVDLAGVYCVMLRVKEAVTILEPIIQAEPEHALALARLAWCRMQVGQVTEALELYQQSIDLMPERLPVWSALTRLYLDTQQLSLAQNVLEQGIACLTEHHAQLAEVTVKQFTEQFRGLQLAIWVENEALAVAEEWLNERHGLLDEDEWVALILSYANSLAGHNQHANAEDTLREALTKYPDNIALLSQFAEFSQIQGRTGQAVQLLKRLINLAKQQDKPEAVYWVRLSNACLHQNEGQARKAVEKAIELSDAMQESESTPIAMIKALRLQAKNALAQVESQAQNFTLAETLFQEVLTENPYFINALQGLGQQCMQCGKMDEAIALFERIKAIDPAKGYSSLINARQFPEEIETLVRMEKIARQPSLEGSVRAGLLLQIASAYEKNKDYEQAFALAREANNTSQQLLNYNAQVHRQDCARTRHAFSHALYQHRKDCGVKSSLPVYVLGMPRSGTTLVEQIIAGHSQIFGAGELGVIPSRIQGLNRWERHTGSGRSYPDCIDDLNPKVVEGIAQGVLDELQAYEPEAQHIIDKLPHNFENIGFIKLLFPNAKIISVRRDPRDIALSNYFTDYQAKHGGMGFAYDLEWIGEQLADHNLLMHHWQQTFPGEILEINYEDVVNDTEGMARKMLDYIGVAWESQVLAFNELDRPVKTASVWQVRQPIYKTSQAKWKRYESYLAPLIVGTNKKIEWDAFDMTTLPEAGLLTDGVALYKEKQFDEAERNFKKLLHHIPDHAAANFMLGIIYAEKNHLNDAIELMEKAHTSCPWNAHWRKDLIQAYEMIGETEKAEALKKKTAPPPSDGSDDKETEKFTSESLG